VSLPEYLLDLPAEEAARLIALALLDRTADTARRLLDPTDPTALHDFRVATRRLRCCLQAYRPEIDGSVPHRLRRRLARLARATTRSRDAEVHLAWERDQEPALSERQRAGLRWHLERLEARRRRADRRLTRHVARRFSPLEARFRQRLERYRLRIERDPSRRRHEAAAVLGSRIRKFAGDLECRLGAVRTMVDEAPAHRARIAAKRLRYLLEPIRSEVDGVIEQRRKRLGQSLGVACRLDGRSIVLHVDAHRFLARRRLHGVDGRLNDVGQVIRRSAEFQRPGSEAPCVQQLADHP